MCVYTCYPSYLSKWPKRFGSVSLFRCARLKISTTTKKKSNKIKLNQIKVQKEREMSMCLSLIVVYSLFDDDDDKVATEAKILIGSRNHTHRQTVMN